MKRLTAITVIIMVPNFVASVFGMNFAHIPAGASQSGFVFVAAFLLIMVVWGFIHSRLLGWL
jgi:Mg2+ and Co2+ transporter CorA